MAALLAGDEQTPSLRGKIGLIYIDPPFDSKADYRTKVTFPAVVPPFAKGEVRYLKEEWLPAFYYPDFLVRTASKIYRVETKAQGQLNHPNVQRKLKAAAAWCERINALDAAQRSGREWGYVLLGEALFYEWRDKGGRMAEVLEFARVRVVGGASSQQRLEI